MKRILVAVDASDMASLVVARAVELARGMGGKLRLFRAVTIPPVPPPPGVFVPPQTEMVMAAAEAAIRSVLEEVPEDLRDGAVVGFGSAADAVCDVARYYDADMVVIGAHRHGIVSRVLGTTAARIVNRIDRPVLVVRPLPLSAKATTTPPASGHRMGAGST